MKQLLTALLLTLTIFLSAQTEYNFQIESNADSSFNLLIIETLGPDRANIQKYSGLDTVELRKRLYGDINATYETIARKQREIDDQLTLRSRLFQALRQKELDNYLTDTRSRLDSFYVAPSWRYLTSQGRDETLTTLFVDDGPTRLRDSTNTNVAAIVPLSRNNILVRFYPLGELDVEMYSTDNRLYTGRDANNVRHILIRRR